jgi:hypothetical protein
MPGVINRQGGKYENSSYFNDSVRELCVVFC